MAKVYVIYEIDGYGGTFSSPDTALQEFESVELAIVWMQEKVKTGFPYFISPGRFHVFEGSNVTRAVTEAVFPKEATRDRRC